MSTTMQDALLRLENVTPVQEEQRHANVLAKARATQRRSERNDLLKTVAIILLLPAVASGWVYREISPVVRQDVQFLPMMPDGTIAKAYRWEYLPNSDRNAVALNSMWNYVRMRESFSKIGAGYAWNAVNAMSNVAVQNEYARTDHFTVASSPWQKYGENVRVEIAYDSHRSLCDGRECGTEDNPIGFEFRFQRVEIIKGVAQRPVLYFCEVRFQRNVEGLDPQLVVTLNGSASQVTYYRPGVPVGAQAARP